MVEQQQLWKLDSKKYNKDLVKFGDIALALADQNAPAAYITHVVSSEAEKTARGQRSATSRALKMFRDRAWTKEAKNRHRKEYEESKTFQEKRLARLAKRAKYAREKRAKDREEQLKTKRTFTFVVDKNQIKLTRNK